MSDKVPYSDALDADEQISAEEQIAAHIWDFDFTDFDEEDAAEMGREILYMVLQRFRPDLFERHPGRP